MADKPEVSEEATPVRRRGGCLRQVLVVGLVLLGLLAVFHRPLVFEATRYFVVRAAKQQNLEITYDISGSLWTSLTVRDLVAKPTESGPIERLEIGLLDLEYSLWGMVRDGLPALLDRVEARDVYVVIDPNEALPPEKEQEPQAFKFPGLFPREVSLENVNVTTRGVDGAPDFELVGASLTLWPERAGELRVETLAIPGVRRWDGIAGATTYADRRLVLTGFSLGDAIEVERLVLDASALEQAVLGVELAAEVVGASVNAKLLVHDLNAGNYLAAEAGVDGLVFEKLWSYLNLEVPLHGRVDRLQANLAGWPEQPRTWVGLIDVQADALAWEAQLLGSLAAKVVLLDGKAWADVNSDLDESNRIALGAKAELPEEVGQLAETALTGAVRGELGNLAALTGALDAPVAGSADVTVDFSLADQEFAADVRVQAPEISSGEGDAATTVSGADVRAQVRKRLDVAEGEPVFRGLRADVNVTADALRSGGVEMNNLSLAAGVDEADVTLTDLRLNRGGNSVNVTGNYTLPEDMQSFDAQPLETDVRIDAPDLKKLVAAETGVELAGSLEVTGSARNVDGKLAGDFLVTGRDVRAAGVTVERIDGNVTISDGRARIPKMDVVLDEQNRLEVTGSVQFEAPFAYDGSAKVDFTDLSTLQALVLEEMGGGLKVDWTGSGNLKEARHQGEVQISLNDGVFGEVKEATARVEGAYNLPETASFPTVEVSTSRGSARLALQLADDAVSVTGLSASLGDLEVLTGSLRIPFYAEHLGGDLAKMLPTTGAVSADLKTGRLALTDLLRELELELDADKVPVTGTVSAEVTAGGSMEALAVRVALQADELQSPEAADVQPAEVSLVVALADDVVTIEGGVRQPLIQPLTVAGRMPLDVEKVLAGGGIPADTPIALTVKMARSPLRFLTAMVPAIRLLEGGATVDLTAGGTIGKPTLAGVLEAEVQRLRLSEEGFPPIVDTTLRVTADTERAVIEQFRGGIAGGFFGASGSVQFGGVDEPVFDVTFWSRNALVAQDEALTLRVNSDIQLTGPLSRVAVTGGVFATKSRFFKNIDILPIALPGRPAPQPPEAPPVVGVTTPPLSNWTFDVKVATADPFIVAGNMANGRIIADLTFGGTGARPWLDGEVRIERLSTTLPFSELIFENSLIFFQRTRPFVAQLDLRATSQIRSYEVTVIVYGTILDPQVAFSSDPPLPETDVVSLIATGTTSQELGNPSVLAGRAAILAFQKISRTLFPNRDRGDRQRTVFDGIDISVGQIDPKTGKQSASVRFPLTSNIVMIGGVDVTGNFRGQVKYLIRFR